MGSSVSVSFFRCLDYMWNLLMTWTGITKQKRTAVMKDAVVSNLSTETNNWMSKKTSSLMLLECISLESLIQDSLAGSLSTVLSSLYIMGCVFRCSSLGRAKPKWDAYIFYLDLYRVFCACQIEPLLLCFVMYYFKVNVVDLVRYSAKFWQV